METKHSNSKDSKYFLSWKLYLELIDELAYRIEDSGKKYESIHGIPRGGLIPAAILAHKLNLPMVGTQDYNTASLLVDDLVDTGNTFEIYGDHYDTAVVFMKPWSKIIPTYFVRMTKNWIVFPYEKKLKGGV